jgi:hypothetical protein
VRPALHDADSEAEAVAERIELPALPPAFAEAEPESGFALVPREEPAEDDAFERTLPLAAAPAPSAPSAEALQAKLRELEPTLRALRSGFAGDERRVTVDRRSMAELLDSLLELCAAADAERREPELIAS